VLDDECLHDRSPRGELASRSQGVEGRRRVGGGAEGMRRPVRARVCGALIGSRARA
jgi:hypothetical protein